jgi:hypothetical protein
MVSFSFSNESFNVDNIVNAAAYRKGWLGLSREISREKHPGRRRRCAAPPGVHEEVRLEAEADAHPAEQK